MKRTIILALSMVVLTVCVTMVFVLTMNNSNKTNDMEYDSSETDQNENTNIISCFRSDSVSDIKEKIAECGANLISFEEGLRFGFNSYSIYGLNTFALFSFDDEKITNTYINIDTGITVQGNSEISTSQREKSENALLTVIEICNSMFGVDIDSAYSFYNNEGLSLPDEEVPYDSWLAGDVRFALFVREKDGTFWKIYGEMLETDTVGAEEIDNPSSLAVTRSLVFQFSRYFDIGLFKDVTADITLEK